ncbi:MAG: response regulator [Gemmiger sp.]|nr:response regulator [Gemmiger sp.]
MMKVLIADDEPLVLVGLQSMIPWQEHGVEICGTAHNGEQALQLIETQHPQIVITDIMMPLKTGLEILRACRDTGAELPVFIMLTSYEDFSYAKEALHYGAVEYLIKLELTPSSLGSVVDAACERVKKLESASAPGAPGYSGLQIYRDKFFVRLYNDLFGTREQFLLQGEALGLQFAVGKYTVIAGEIEEQPLITAMEQAITLYSSATEIVRDTVEKFAPCYMTSLDLRHFNILLDLQALPEGWQNRLAEILHTAVRNVRSYFNVQVLCAAGACVEDVYLAGHSYSSARLLLPQLTPACPIQIGEGHASGEGEQAASVLRLADFRGALARAFEELDTEALGDTIGRIADACDACPADKAQAMNAAGSLLHMATSLLPEGEATVEHIFADEPDNYLSLYRLGTTKLCTQWMRRLRDGLCATLQERKQGYKKRIILNVQEYIRSNLSKRLLLGDVAAAFNFSPNYLSQLFAQSSDKHFVDYVTEEKIGAAKTMLAQGDKKVYEVAECLGYENAFYFSKVFKKVTGQTPREYLQGHYQ